MKYILIVMFLVGCTCITEPEEAPIPDKQWLDFGCPPGQYWDYNLEICVHLPLDTPEGE